MATWFTVRMTHMNAKRNEYAEALGDLLDKTPKAVLAAMLVSKVSNGGDYLGDPAFDLRAELLDEWQCLHDAGIVPQRPPRVDP